jgi:periplasmic protein TonB
MSAATAWDAGWVSDGGDGGRGALRWFGCLVVAVGVHASLALGLINWSIPVEPTAAPEAVMMIDLAPLPPAPEPEPPPPEPQPVRIQPPPPPPPPEPEPEPVVEQLPEPPPKVEPVVVLQKPKPKPPKVKPKPQPQPIERPPEPREPEPAPPVVAAPKVAPPAPAPPAASGPPPSFQSLLLAHLQRHKRYPRAAQLRRQQGVAQLRFTMDREGKVIWYRIERGSGSELLDEEVTSMIERAQPLPKIPDDVPDKQLEFLVPVQFMLK